MPDWHEDPQRRVRHRLARSARPASPRPSSTRTSTVTRPGRASRSRRAKTGPVSPASGGSRRTRSARAEGASFRLAGSRQAGSSSSAGSHSSTTTQPSPSRTGRTTRPCQAPPRCCHSRSRPGRRPWRSVTQQCLTAGGSALGGSAAGSRRARARPWSRSCLACSCPRPWPQCVGRRGQRDRRSTVGQSGPGGSLRTASQVAAQRLDPSRHRWSRRSRSSIRGTSSHARSRNTSQPAVGAASPASPGGRPGRASRTTYPCVSRWPHQLGHRLLGHLGPPRQHADRRAVVVEVLEDRACAGRTSSCPRSASQATTRSLRARNASRISTASVARPLAPVQWSTP